MFVSIAALVLALVVQGCICTCITADFEAACRDHGGRVEVLGASQTCVVDAGVVATWIDEEDGGS
jgi:hypothetical protein